MANRNSSLGFYEYRQNNSGGRWSSEPRFIFVQAASPTEADKVAQEHGVYFDGVRSGRDCACCGDRWSQAMELYHHKRVPHVGVHYKVVRTDGSVKVFNKGVAGSR